MFLFKQKVVVSEVPHRLNPEMRFLQCQRHFNPRFEPHDGRQIFLPKYAWSNSKVELDNSSCHSASRSEFRIILLRTKLGFNVVRLPKEGEHCKLSVERSES
ncbi:hypothetical protein VNO80_13605 [Phaseolus coccineus]|uniref:Uncharacterized protein n=1 Tax=Phaseolus coccineus TaxID=3886 RepID=A0AAN9N206_PHACN